MAEHDVRLPVADEPRHLLAVLQRRHELAVMDVEDLVLDPEDPRALRHLRLAALRERPAGHGEVADVAVGHRHELHLGAFRGPQRRHAAGLQLRIVGVRAEGDDPERTGGRLGARRRGLSGQDRQRSEQAG